MKHYIQPTTNTPEVELEAEKYSAGIANLNDHLVKFPLGGISVEFYTTVLMS